MYRQGDVLVMAIDHAALPSNLIDAPRDRNNRLVLARGEATGHAHVLTGERVVMRCPPDQPETLYLLIEGYGRLVHEEHGPIGIPAGVYRVIRQREYEPGAIRPVND
jgi:hypothetical protein